METSLPRVRGFAISARTFRSLATASAFMSLLVIVTGATVRLTASGLGCQHWPGCQSTQFLPEKGYHSIIEFTNRGIAGVTVLATLLAFVGSLLYAGAPRWLRWTAGVVFAGTFAQAPLGAITVHYHLNPWLVLSHFLLSMAVLPLAVLVALEAWQLRGDPVPALVRRASLVLGLAAVLMIVAGTLATAGGPHPGSSADVRRLDTFGSAVYWHVRATAVFGVSLALLLAWLWRSRSSHVRFGLGVVGVLVVQMVVGEVQYRTELPWWLVLIHVFLAASLWAATAAFVLSLWRPAPATRILR
ncbi:MAG: COX15/CtaA family protein [Actinobacteria bacterium]|nr:COX15/CtaA family protein [Actinomycetota bacterium]